MQLYFMLKEEKKQPPAKKTKKTKTNSSDLIKRINFVNAIIYDNHK